MTTTENVIEGYSRFMDIEDQELQAYNRAQVLTNMFERGAKHGKVGISTVALIGRYFAGIPTDERRAALDKFRELNNVTA